MKRPKNIWKLDPKSDRYRICPECDKAFMTEHRSRDFCTKKCANEYNNKKKRFARSAEVVMNTSDYPYSRSSNYTSEDKPEKNPVSAADSPILEIQEADQVLKSKMTKQFKVLLGLEQEVQISLDQIKDSKIDLTAYDSLERLPQCDLRKANYGDYSLIWVEPDAFLLTYQKHLLWTLAQ